jgi:hypothetical protein
MKNIHILPTDKSSRLHNYTNDGLGLSKKVLNWKDARHIYITNSEEIKDRDWFYDLDTKYIKVKKSFENSHLYFNGKKIILTTDQDLIKDGVQAIDDEFLEWFVKNPSCEEVEVEKWFDKNSDEEYFIPIIPKEEPKQEKIDFVYWLMDNCQLITDSETQENVLWRYDSEDYTVEGLFKVFVDFSNPNADKLSSASTTTIKQETIEEAAERILANNIDGLRDDLKDDDLFFFYKGFVQFYGEAMAEWQQEQMYSEEDMKKAFNSSSLTNMLDVYDSFEEFIEQF